MGERSFDDFDPYAKDYRSVHTRNLRLSGADSLYFARHKVMQLQDWETNGNACLLDVGCGDGAVEMYLRETFTNWQLQGVDVSKESLDAAVVRNIPNVQFTHFDGYILPFADATFHIVLMAAVLHHVAPVHQVALLQECYRVLKPGGRLYIFEHNPLNPITRYLVHTCPFDRDARLLWPGYTKRILSQAGFQSSTRQFILFLPRKGIFTGLLFIERFLKWLPLGGQYYFRAVK